MASTWPKVFGEADKLETVLSSGTDRVTQGMALGVIILGRFSPAGSLDRRFLQMVMAVQVVAVA